MENNNGITIETKYGCAENDDVTNSQFARPSKDSLCAV